MWNPNISHGRQNLCSGRETVDVGDPYDAINNKNMEFLVPDAAIVQKSGIYDVIYVHSKAIFVGISVVSLRYIRSI